MVMVYVLLALYICGCQLYPVVLGYSEPSCLLSPLGQQRSLVPSFFWGSRLCQGQQQIVDLVYRATSSNAESGISFTVPLIILSWRTANCRCLLRFSTAVAIIYRKYRIMSRFYRATVLCVQKSRVMSPLVNSYIIQIILAVISVDFCPRLCSICPRSL